MMVVCWVYGIMGFTGYDINPQTVTIGALSLGLKSIMQYISQLDWKRS